MPVATEGLRIHCRRPFSAASSVFDAPLASRFDENDAVMVFENAFVPWENVLVYRDLDKAKEFYKTALKQKSKSPASAKKTLQRILKMVPKSSPSYSKALKLLSKIK